MWWKSNDNGSQFDNDQCVVCCWVNDMVICNVEKMSFNNLRSVRESGDTVFKDCEEIRYHSISVKYDISVKTFFTIAIKAGMIAIRVSGMVTWVS